MFGLSLEHLLVLLVAGLFILGPERLPESARWLARNVRKAREFATGAQERITSELGPEFQQLRKPLQDLQTLRTFDPRTAISRYLLDDALPEPPTPAATVPGTEAAPATGAPLHTGERPPFDPDAT